MVLLISIGMLMIFIGVVKVVFRNEPLALNSPKDFVPNQQLFPPYRTNALTTPAPISKHQVFERLLNRICNTDVEWERWVRYNPLMGKQEIVSFSTEIYGMYVVCKQFEIRINGIDFYPQDRRQKKELKAWFKHLIKVDEAEDIARHNRRVAGVLENLR